jgi:hypothetical protein
MVAFDAEVTFLRPDSIGRCALRTSALDTCWKRTTPNLLLGLAALCTLDIAPLDVSSPRGR